MAYLKGQTYRCFWKQYHPEITGTLDYLHRNQQIELLHKRLNVFFINKIPKVRKRVKLRECQSAYLWDWASSWLTPHRKSTSLMLTNRCSARARSSGNTNRVSKLRSACMSRNVDEIKTRHMRHLHSTTSAYYTVLIVSQCKLYIMAKNIIHSLYKSSGLPTSKAQLFCSCVLTVTCLLFSIIIR